MAAYVQWLRRERLSWLESARCRLFGLVKGCSSGDQHIHERKETGPVPANTPQACSVDFTAALIGQDMQTALTLLTNDVIFFYSNGSAIVGREAFSSLMTASWKMLHDYKYASANPVWVTHSDTAAAVIYSFAWKGRVRDQTVGGGGRGTRVMRNDGSGWRIAHEHLSTGDWKQSS